MKKINIRRFGNRLYQGGTMINWRIIPEIPSTGLRCKMPSVAELSAEQS